MQTRLEIFSTNHDFTPLEYDKQHGDDNISTSLSKDEFPPVFDETSSVTRPKCRNTLKPIQKDSVSSVISDDKSYQSVSILITDTSNFPSIDDEPATATDNDELPSATTSVGNLKDDKIQIHQNTTDRYFTL